jgi:RNA-binding protein
MAESPTDADPKLGELKARAQLLKPIIRVSHEGLTQKLIAALNQALDQHELVKIKFMASKDQKKVLAKALEVQTNARLVQQVGHTATYWRAKKKANAAGRAS